MAGFPWAARAADPRPAPSPGGETEAQTAERLGLSRPWAHPDLRGTCPGSAPYGHGLSLTVVHGRCCDAWAAARAEADGSEAAQAAASPEARREAVAATYRDLYAAQQAHAAGQQQLPRNAAGTERLAELRQAETGAAKAHATAVAEFDAAAEPEAG